MTAWNEIIPEESARLTSNPEMVQNENTAIASLNTEQDFDLLG